MENYDATDELIVMHQHTNKHRKKRFPIELFRNILTKENVTQSKNSQIAKKHLDMRIYVCYTTVAAIAD